MVPGLFDAPAGRVAMHQKAADARGFLIGAGPDHHPGQGRRSGGVDLAARQPPALGRAPGHGRGQATAGGGAEVRLDPQSVDQGAGLDGVGDHPPAQVFRPAAPAIQRALEQVLHGQDQGRGRFTPRHRPHHLERGRKVRPAAAQLHRRRQGQQPGPVQGPYVLEWEAGIAVMDLRRGGEPRGQLGQDPIQVGQGAHGSRGDTQGGSGHDQGRDDGNSRQSRPLFLVDQ